MDSLLDATQLEDARAGAPVYLPVNPIEYHGPHLSLLNDHLVSVGLARDLARALGRWPFVLANDLSVGVDPTPGPGTQPVSFSEVRARVVQACAELADAGARRVVLMTFHGNPLHSMALQAGVELLERRGVRVLAPLNLALKEMLEIDSRRYADAFADIEDPAERERAMRDLPVDFHAGFFETSLALHYAPESVRPIYRSLPPCPDFAPVRPVQALAAVARAAGARSLSAELGYVAAGLSWFALRPFPGYTGRPHLASARAGERFARHMVSGFAELAEAVFAGRARSPRPIMQWLPWLSLGGRVGSPNVPPEAVLEIA